MADDGLLIGKVAAQTKLNPKTIRYYEAIGLLPKPRRGENRYRLYSKEVVELLQFVKQAQGLGFTLAEMQEIVAMRQQGQEPCVHVRALVKQKAADLDRKLRDLIELQRKLKRLLKAWDEYAKRRKTSAVVCPHIEGEPLQIEKKKRRSVSRW